jgi:hypothetical protein
MVTAIEIQSAMMHAKPYVGDLNPKKSSVQRKLRKSWIPNNEKERLASFFLKPFSHTRYSDIPIRVYKVSQTGPNSQPGGVKFGFRRFAYHTGRD